MAAALTQQLILTRNVCQWTRKVLIPEAQEANVSLSCFLAVVEDVPGSLSSLDGRLLLTPGRPDLNQGCRQRDTRLLGPQSA
jgi:hypothetical protein